MVDVPREVLKQVPKWKKCGYEPHFVQFEIDRVYSFVVKMLTRDEYLELVEEAKPADLYPPSPVPGIDWPPPVIQNLGTDHVQEVIRAGLLWPASLTDDMPAGIDVNLAQAIVAISGWIDPQSLVDGMSEARQYVHTLQGFLETSIMRAFPNMTRDSLCALNFRQFIRLVGISELVSGQQIDLRPWLAPEEYAREIEKLEKRQRRDRAAKFEHSIAAAGKNAEARQEAFKRYMLNLAEDSTSDLGSRGDKPNFEKHNEMLRQI